MSLTDNWRASIPAHWSTERIPPDTTGLTTRADREDVWMIPWTLDDELGNLRAFPSSKRYTIRLLEAGQVPSLHRAVRDHVDTTKGLWTWKGSSWHMSTLSGWNQWLNDVPPLPTPLPHSPPDVFQVWSQHSDLDAWACRVQDDVWVICWCE